MSKIKTLEARIKELETLVAAQQHLLEVYRSLNPVPVISSPFISVPIDPCQHSYPNVWGGTTPPACVKCGKPAPQWTVTCQSGGPDWHPV